MSTLVALTRIRRQRELLPNHEIADLVASCRAMSSDVANLDFERASALDGRMPQHLAINLSQDSLLAIINYFFELQQPNWLKHIRSGLNAILTVCDDDEIQVLRTAGLIDNPLSIKAILFWDKWAALSRMELDQKLALIGREGEHLVFEAEQDYVASIGCPYPVTWVATLDNSLGYDIETRRKIDGEWQTIAIEVKTSTRDNGLFVTRNERLVSENWGARYFYVYLPSASLEDAIVINAAEVAAQLPTDSSASVWEVAHVLKVDAFRAIPYAAWLEKPTPT